MENEKTMTIAGQVLLDDDVVSVRPVLAGTI